MVSKTNKRIALVRDFAVSLFSVVVVGSSWGKWVQEPVFYVVDSLGLVFIVLSVVDVILIRRDVQRRGFYFGNAIYQLFPSFIFAGPLVVGWIFLILNIAVLVTLKQKKIQPVEGAPSPQQPMPAAS